MAEPTAPAPRVFTDSEVEALVADRVNRETADLTSKADGLQASVTDLQTKLDVETAAKVAAEQERDTARTELETERQTIVAEREAAARKDQRLTELREVASHLGDDFFADENRVARICAYDEDSFTAYKADLAATATTAPGGSGQPPRQTAMAGAPATTGQPTGEGIAPAATKLLGRRLLGQEG